MANKALKSMASISFSNSIYRCEFQRKNIQKIPSTENSYNAQQPDVPPYVRKLINTTKAPQELKIERLYNQALNY